MEMLKTKMPVKNIRAYVGDTVNNNRSSGDFYSTPRQCTLDLLEREKFEGEIWECACGDGAISKVLLEHSYKVISTDLVDRGYGLTGIDFLECNNDWVCENIITNPPFKYGYEFVEHGLSLTKKKLIVFNKLSFLEGKKRRHIFDLGFLKNIYVYTKRVDLSKEQKGGMLAFAWFVFDKTYQGKPTLDWI